MIQTVKACDNKRCRGVEKYKVGGNLQNVAWWHVCCMILIIYFPNRGEFASKNIILCINESSCENWQKFVLTKRYFLNPFLTNF